MILYLIIKVLFNKSARTGGEQCSERELISTKMVTHIRHTNMVNPFVNVALAVNMSNLHNSCAKDLMLELATNMEQNSS